MSVKRIIRDRISDGVFGVKRLAKPIVLAQNSCRILMYHSIEDVDTAKDPMNLAVSPETFYMQMEYLKLNGFRVISLAELSGRIAEGAAIPPKSVTVTFDDGFRSILTHAFPVLKKFGFQATLFVNIYFIERKLPEDLYWRQWQTLNWGEVKRLHDEGLGIGSHAFTHRRLTSVEKGELEREIVTSKELIEKNIGSSVSTFCYPHGIFNAEVKKKVIDTGYHSSCSSIEGVNKAGSDIFALRRTEIFPFDDTPFKFEKKMLGSQDWLRFVRSHD